MNNGKRWQTAQQHEQQWWEERRNSIQLSYLKRFAENVINEISEFFKFDENNRILEIGSGPAGIITHLSGSNRYGIDPLEEYFYTVKEYTAYRDPQVKYLTAKGENLPFEDHSFDLILIDNVLDHCDSPEKVIQEANRVLAHGGILYFKQNIYYLIGKIIRNIIEHFEIDKKHPYNFTKKDTYKFFSTYDFIILSEKNRNHFEQFMIEIKSRNYKAFLRLLLFMTRGKITLILKKK